MSSHKSFFIGFTELSLRDVLSKLPENCPVCGEKIKKGYISASRPVDIWWSEERPSFSKLFFGKGFRPLVKGGFWEFPITEAFRCPNCKIVLFSYGEEKKEKKHAS